MDLNIFLGVFAFIFGLCIGSFLNCVIYRLEQKKSITGRSFCPHCKHTLSWKDLFPLFSFLLLKGKCRYCRKKISAQYPLLELITGILFLIVFFAFQASFYTVFGFYIISVLAIIFVYDFKHYLIPDKILFPAIIIALAYDLFDLKHITSYVWGIAIAAGFFLIIFLVSKGKWMGFGDVKLAVLMGLVLGFPNIVLALFLAFFFGAIIGLILMVLEGKTLKSEIPFGPFLIFGTFISLIWGTEIVQWYLNILGI